MPCLPQASWVFVPSSCSFSMPMIRSSLKPPRRLVHILVDGANLPMAEIEGRTSWPALSPFAAAVPGLTICVPQRRVCKRLPSAQAIVDVRMIPMSGQMRAR